MDLCIGSARHWDLQGADNHGPGANGHDAECNGVIAGLNLSLIGASPKQNTDN